MAKKEALKFKQKYTYDNKKYITDRSKDPDYNLKVTEPGQAISVKQLVEKYKKQKQLPNGQ